MHRSRLSQARACAEALSGGMLRMRYDETWGGAGVDEGTAASPAPPVKCSCQSRQADSLRADWSRSIVPSSLRLPEVSISQHRNFLTARRSQLWRKRRTLSGCRSLPLIPIFERSSEARRLDLLEVAVLMNCLSSFPMIPQHRSHYQSGGEVGSDTTCWLHSSKYSIKSRI